MDNTLLAFLGTDNLSKRLVNRVLDNLEQPHTEEMVFNLTQVAFDFERGTASISYFVVDPDYPDVELSFPELRKLLAEMDS